MMCSITCVSMTSTRKRYFPILSLLRTARQSEIASTMSYGFNLNRLFAFRKKIRNVVLIISEYFFDVILLLGFILMIETSRFSYVWRKMFYSLYASYGKIARFRWWKRKIILSLYKHISYVMNHTKHHKCASLTPSTTSQTNTYTHRIHYGYIWLYFI